MMQSRGFLDLRSRSGKYSAIACGCFDSFSAFCYIIDLNIVYVYAIILISKSYFLLIFRAPGMQNFSANLPIIIYMSIMIALSSVYNSTDIADLMPVANFLLQITFTLLLLDFNSLKFYIHSVGFLIFLLLIVYLLTLFSGNIPDVYGRYTFFNGLHPNLGSEIFATGVVIASVSFTLRANLLFAALSMVSLISMQGRSAELVVFLSVMICISLKYWKFMNRRIIFALYTGFVSLVFFSVTIFIFVPDLISNILLLDDEYRGVGTGFVGRGDIWEIGINTFFENPIFGAGPNSNAGDHGFHNFYIYAFATFGAMVIILFAYLVFLIVISFRENMTIYIKLSPILILTIFNDRFMNANLYPFVFYIIVFSLGAHKIMRGKTVMQ